MYRFAFALIFCLHVAGLALGKQGTGGKVAAVQVAFLADAHLSDIYGTLGDSDYRGLKNPGNGKFVIARTMESQLNSTRLFNENYFAFLAALDDVVERGVRYVVMPGDFSDDGQPLNIRGLKRILGDYEAKYGIQFILSTGNHDPVRPFALDAGKRDFLGEGGRRQAIASKEDFYEEAGGQQLPVVVTSDIRKLGYEEILDELGAFGFMPREGHVYWESPFSDYSAGSYDYKVALRQSGYERRRYEVAPGYEVPDVSYLVEPEEGVWFLSIDANVYLPKGGSPANPESYSGSSIGYNNVLTHKTHLLEWVGSVMKRGKKLGKKVFVFSHYPMVEFNDGATAHIRTLLGKGKMQEHRVPRESVAELFARAGVTAHFGGHMHINDTGVRVFEEGKGLVNVQIPSLAAYIPAYKLVTYSDSRMDVETIVLDEVPRFRELFPLYEREHEYLMRSGSGSVWDRGILEAKDYRAFTQWHLKELVRLRLLDSDWPLEIKEYLMGSEGRDLLELAGIEESGVDAASFGWSGFDMIYDFYRLRSADKLAFSDITLERIAEYEVALAGLLNMELEGMGELAVRRDLREFAHVFRHFMNGAPADSFTIDVERGRILGKTE